MVEHRGSSLILLKRVEVMSLPLVGQQLVCEILLARARHVNIESARVDRHS